MPVNKKEGRIPYLMAYVTIFVHTIAIFIWLQKLQPSAYMDEIFHIPQAQKYCNQSYEWDPMITTLPGLYIISLIILKPFTYLPDLDEDSVCTTALLRATNIIFFLGSFSLFYHLQKRINKYEKNISDAQHIMTAVNLVTFPLLYFFTFLYYTDAGSTFFVLLSYLLYLEERHILSAFFGACSIMFRQTNIIWVVFIAGIVVAREVEKNTRVESQVTHSIVLNSLLMAIKSVFVHLYKVPNFIFILILLSPYICVMFLFAVFVYTNDGIVVGDRNNHQACLNFPQMFYFFSFTMALGAPFLISLNKMCTFFKASLRNPFILVILFTISTVLINNFTYVHPYLLADNRHYTFYVWMKIYSRHELVRVALVPIYLYAGWSIFASMDSEPCTYLFKLVFFICLATATIPQKLMEFRYFIVPYMLARLHMSTGNNFQLVLEFILYQIVNVITLYLFAFRPFTWPDSEQLQRFMW